MRFNLSLFTLAGLACVAAFAQNVTPDGVILIDQQHALVGGIGPGDASGFPITISQPGSYRLASNLTVPNADTTAILIESDNVSIDLNGFSIVGPTVCTSFLGHAICPMGFGNGIFSGEYTDTKVRNGSVKGMGNDGIALIGGGGSVEKLHVSSCGGDGIDMIGGKVIDSIAESNGVAGFDIGGGTAIGNIALSNGSFGFRLTCPSTAANNLSYTNFSIPALNGIPGTCALANNSFLH